MNCKPSKNTRADNDLNSTGIVHGIPPEVILEAPIPGYGFFARLFSTAAMISHPHSYLMASLAFGGYAVLAFQSRL
jgi:hypothetical protein